MKDEILKEMGLQGLVLSNRQEALILLHELDLESQLLAISGALKRNEAAEAAVTKRIKQLQERARAYDGDDELVRIYLVDDWVDAMHHTVFQDAAHSMAAVGMLAPFIESLFVAIFQALRRAAQGNVKHATDDPRTIAYESEFWDPHNVIGSNGSRRDIVVGIRELAQSTGLSVYLPDACEKTLTALFAYRNKMFHHGFEWPEAERESFGNRIRSEKWPDNWFRTSRKGDDPWIFYMSRGFIQHCLVTIDGVLEGVGAYLKEKQ